LSSVNRTEGTERTETYHRGGTEERRSFGGSNRAELSTLIDSGVDCLRESRRQAGCSLSGMLAREPEINDVTSAIIGAAVEIHRALGPGLLESAYHACLVYEFRERGQRFEASKPLPLSYKGVHLDCGYRLDFIVEDRVVVEVKSVATLAPIHTAQLMTYLKLTGCRAGLLLNFNVPVLKQGVRRVLRRGDETNVAP